MSERVSLRAACLVAGVPLLLTGTRGPGPRPGTGPADTLTAAYEVAGVRVIQRLSRASDIVAVRLYLLGGTQQLTPRTAGIEALLLRTSSMGTAQFPGEEAHRAMDRTGSVVTLDPDVDWTVFGFTGLVADLDAAWRVFADRVAHPTLADEDVARERTRLLAAARRRYTEPDLRLHAIAMQALFRDHPYGLDPAGTEASLAGLTAEDVKTYHRERLVTSRMLLVVVGDVTRAHVESLVTTTLGQLPRGTYRWILPPLPPERKAQWLIEQRPIPTTYMLGLFAGPSPTSRYYWAFRVATALLSSGLNRTIRTERGLSYAAYAPYEECAIPVAGVYASTPKPDKVLPLMVREMQLLGEREYDFFALQRFIDSFSFDYLADNATAAGQADFLARAELYLGSYKSGADFVKRLHDVSPADIQGVVALYMTKIQYAYLGDTTRMHGRW
jgi:zinc protease